ncbi:MAG: hypothetical protein EZS28_006667 [Streblomastix strix]|uniref:Uncharacterized protein n=1 Tax=Streblomastix strix TaxID=222440 RepID=A0A5J4WTV8_9EUKA|nr:MAG: hypothetical protein EZS28_006667 [Streblomastix strix]
MIRQQYQQQQQLSPQNSPVLPPIDFKFQTIQPFDLLLDSIITFYEDISRAYFLFRTNIVALPQPVVIFAAIAQGNYVAVNRLLEIIQRHITDTSILHNQADAILKGLVLVFMGFFDLTYLIPIDDEDDEEDEDEEQSILSISDEDEEDDGDEKGKGFKKKRNGNIVKLEGNKNKNSNKNKQKKKKQDQTIGLSETDIDTQIDLLDEDESSTYKKPKQQRKSMKKDVNQKQNNKSKKNQRQNSDEDDDDDDEEEEQEDQDQDQKQESWSILFSHTHSPSFTLDTIYSPELQALANRRPLNQIQQRESIVAQNQLGQVQMWVENIPAEGQHFVEGMHYGFTTKLDFDPNNIPRRKILAMKAMRMALGMDIYDV